MKSLRIIHFADLHLGVESGGRPNPASGLNQRVHDVLDRLDELCAVAESEGVHAVVFAGDAFKHQHPTPTLQSLFAERIRRLARSGTSVFLLIGNHDLPKATSLAHPFSIYDALEVEGVVVGDRAKLYRLPLGRDAPVPELQVAALPHFSRHHVLSRLPDGTDADSFIREEVARTVQRLASETDTSAPALFAGHCHVNQAKVNPAQSMFGASELEVTLSSLSSSGAFPYIALGHVHSRQVLSPEPFVAYSGSLERVDFGEGEVVHVEATRVRTRAGEDKGFYLFDLAPAGGGWVLDGEPRFHAVAARRFLTLHTDARAAQDPTAHALEAVARAQAAGAATAGAFVKIVVRVEAEDRVRLSQRALRDAVADAYDVRVVADSPPDSSRLRDPRFAVRMTESEALEQFVSARDDWADDAGELLRLGRRLIEEVTA
ncbi:MAG TPA: exonuclease subunit SbcD [Actinomycetota bacterium]|nr:exonuclease subunit SbcD [Actinomycetota bacterium]